MAIYKRCGRCGKRIPSGSRCPCGKVRHKEYDRYSRDKKSKQYYDSSEWSRSRAAALEADQNYDVYIFMTEGRILGADTVHHIIPLKEDWNQRNNMENLMSLHHDTHSFIEALYRKDEKKIQKELQQMLIEYRKLVGAGGI